MSSRIYRMDRAGFFVNLSLAPVLRFRRRFVSVSKALSSMGLPTPGSLLYGTDGVLFYEDGPTGPITSFEPWTHWIPPDLHGFYKWAMDVLALLAEFVLKVVHSRQTARLQAWSNWIREDLISHPYQWLRPDFVPPAPHLVCNPQDSPNGSGILVQPALVDAHFRKAWMPYFRRGEGTLLSGGSPPPEGLSRSAHPYRRGAS